MALQVTGLSITRCTFGLAPSLYLTFPIHMEITFIMPAATIFDTFPFFNMLPFVMCQSKMNPMVLAVMLASFGAVQVAPCIPMTFFPWTPPISNVLVGGVPTVDNTARAMCLWGGMIQTIFPGQVTTIVL